RPSPCGSPPSGRSARAGRAVPPRAAPAMSAWSSTSFPPEGVWYQKTVSGTIVAIPGNLHRTRSAETRMGYRIGIDVGGTFTDYVLLDERGGTRAHKVLSTPADPSQAVLQGLGDLAAGAGLPLAGFLERVDIIVHGTTVTTNAVLTGRIARAG